MPQIPPRAVIDTQIVMDWLVFGEPRLAPLVEALESGQLKWIGRPPMLDELRHVLSRGVAAERLPNLPRIEEVFALRCHMIEAEPAPAVRLICRDPDDQKFIDLALAERATWLFSRDKAVLALRKRALAFGLTITTIESWKGLS